MAKLSLEALDLVSGGMDVRTLQTHLGGASGLGSAHSPTGGPGFAPILGQQFDPSNGLDSPLGSPLGMHQGTNSGLSPYGAMPNQGLDPYAQGAPYGSPYGQISAAPPPQRESSFAENVQAITGIMSAFAGMIGQFTGGAQAGAPAGGRMSAPREQNEQPEEQGLGAARGSSQEAPMEPSESLDTSEPATGASAAEPTGGNTNFRETSTGFERT